MRRILSLLLLLCFAATQAAAAACPMADGPGAAGDGARTSHDGHGAHPAAAHPAAHGGEDAHADRPAPAREHGAHHDPSADGGCGIVMPCGVFAPPPADAPASLSGARTAEAGVVPLSRPPSPDPAAEPPPPRLADPDRP